MNKQDPTRAEILNFLNESLEIADLRSRLQKFNMQIAQDRAEELKALIFISQVTNPKMEGDVEEHVITEEDITNNPDLVNEGISVGDTVTVPSLKRKLKKETPTKE